MDDHQLCPYCGRDIARKPYLMSQHDQPVVPYGTVLLLVAWVACAVALCIVAANA